MKELPNEVRELLTKWVKGAQKVRIHFKGAMNLAVAEFRMEGMVTGFHEQTLNLSFVDHWTSIMLSLQGCQIEPLPPVPLPGHGSKGPFGIREGVKIQFPSGEECVVRALAAAAAFV
jgi:hypothetical protein